MIGQMKQEGKARLVQAEGDYRRSNQCPANWSRTQSPSDPKPYSEVTKTWKAKELFDPNFTSPAGDFFTKILSI